jgi:hypothetical protein
VADNYGDVRSRIQGVVQFLDLVKKDGPDLTNLEYPVLAQVVKLYASVIALLPRIAYFDIDHVSRLRSLSVGHSIVTVGASHALMLSKPQKALEMLEQGRGIFWTHSLRLRSAFDDVPSDLQKELLHLARQLETTVDFSNISGDQQLIEKAVSQRLHQTARFESLVQQVRTLPGHNRFLLHDEYATLAASAVKGPVVVLISSANSSNAVIIQSTFDPMTIPLLPFTHEWLVDAGVNWRSILMEAQGAHDTRLSLKKAKVVNAPRKMNVDDVLECLWTHVVWPVFSALNLKVSGLCISLS